MVYLKNINYVKKLKNITSEMDSGFGIGRRVLPLSEFVCTYIRFLFEKQGLINEGCWAMLDVMCFTLGGPSLTAWKALMAGVEISCSGVNIENLGECSNVRKETEIGNSLWRIKAIMTEA